MKDEDLINWDAENIGNKKIFTEKILNISLLFECSQILADLSL